MDPLIKSQLLYRLSYRSAVKVRKFTTSHADGKAATCPTGAWYWGASVRCARVADGAAFHRAAFHRADIDNGRQPGSLPRTQFPCSRAKTNRPLAGMRIAAEQDMPSRGADEASIAPPLPATHAFGKWS